MSLIGKKEKALRLPLRAVVCALLCLFFPMKSVDSSYLPVTGSNIGLGTSTPVAGLAVMNGNVGVGTWSPTARLQVVGTVSAANFVGDGSGLTGISSNSGWTDGGTNVYTSTTTDNVGIGTTTPIAKLQIAQDNDYNPSDSTSANQLIVRGIANPNEKLLIGIDTSDNFGFITPIETGVGGYPLMLNSNNVSIGNTINSNATLSMINVAAAGSAPSIVFEEGGTDTDFWMSRTDTDGNSGTDNDRFDLGKGSTPGSNILMTVTGAGNVGVGTFAPTMPLEVVSRIVARPVGNGTATAVQHSQGGDYSGAVNAIMNGDDTVGAFHAGMYSSSNTGNWFALIGERMHNSSWNTSGPGAVSSGYYLPGIAFAGQTDGNAGTGMVIGAAVNGIVDGAVSSGVLPSAIIFRTSLTDSTGLAERMRITSGGNVGIGTASPTQKLQVVGTVNATAFVGDGSGLTGISSNSGWTDGGTNVYTSTTTDNVAIGTTTPNAQLLVQNVGAQDSFRVNDALPDGSPFIIDAAGNVGISTTEPQDNFYVGSGGYARVDGGAAYRFGNAGSASVRGS